MAQTANVWSEYLTENEKVVSEHKIGYYDVATTTERVMFLRNFPTKSYSEARYDNIHSLSHKTHPDWPKLVGALIWLGAGYYVYTISPLAGSMVLTDFLSDIIKNYLKELKILPVGQIASALAAVMILYGLYNLMKFAKTLQGVFMVTLKDKSPIRVQTSLTPELRKLMKEIEAGMSEAAKPKPIAAVAAVQPAAAAEEPPKTEDIFGKIREGISSAKENAVILINSKSESQADAVKASLTVLAKEKGKLGVYIALSRPYAQITKDLTEAGVPADKLLFIDAVSYMTGQTPEKKPGVAYIENPSSLEEVGMYLDVYLQKNKPSFVFLDSLDSLMIYNDEKTTREFAHYLINKLRMENLAGTIISVEKKEVENIVKTLVPMCDKQIRV
jgi:hypothetical protein